MEADEKNKHKTRVCHVKSMPNFRVVYENVQNPILYRSSRPDFLEGEDLQSFNELGIKMIVDLRSHSSYKKIKAPKEIDKFYQPYVISLPKKRGYDPGETVMCKALDKESFSVGSEEISGRQLGVPRKHLFLDFMLPKVMMSYLKMLPWYMIIYAFFVMLYDIIFRTSFKNFILLLSKQILNEIGPAKVLCITMDYSDNLVCSVLRLLTYKENVPALINCSHGKDRSGILSALVLWILGKSEEFILEDYGMSKEGLEPMKDRLHKEVIVDYGLNPVFCEANPAVMKEILDHLKMRHGSIENYLENIGFGLEEQQKLKKNFGLEED
ncbi:hypothetical protein FSP39_012721 [Pinctada imbricata]|uniref:Tyrosine specific protein phosphatases domain-containing protein n=1 Tax=Pinctada imbricata TaxID=66713 RepID=A0AA88XFA0_PINIB|nr:hypothetical protein FSP39_012721 [Pinctada imbricata]